MLTESYRILRDLNDLLLIAAAVARFASVLAPAGQSSDRRARSLAVRRLFSRRSARGRRRSRRSTRRRSTSIRAQLDEADFAEAWEQGRALTADEAVALALDALD